MADAAAPTLTILVAFATANTGAKVVELLSKSGKAAVHAYVRNADKPEAQELAKLSNVTLIQGDLEKDKSGDVKSAALSTALKGVSRAFLVTGAGEDEQYDREVGFIKAATEAGVEAIVRISTANVLISKDSEGVYARAHAKIEEYIEKHNSPVIDLRPGWFYSNWLSSAGEIKELKRLTWPIKPENFASQKFGAVDPRDIAGAAAAILLLPPEKLGSYLQGRAFEIHGPQEITYAEKLEAIKKATGHDIEHQYIEPHKWSEALQSYGMSRRFADSFKDTVLMMGGEKPCARPPVNKSSPLLLDIYKPKYSIQDWAKDNKAAFA